MTTRFFACVALVSLAAGLSLLPASAAVAGEDACRIDLDAIGDDFVDLFKEPGSWGTEEWLAFGATGALTTGLILGWDEDIHRASIERPGSFPYVVIHKLAWLGGWYGKNDINPVITFAALTGGLFVVGKATDDDYLVRTTGIMTEAYLFTGFFTAATKLLAGRSRPYTGDGSRRWRFVGLHTRDTRSFPSGHTASAFSMATVLTRRHNDWWVHVPAWTLAAGAASQRIDSGVHWTSDVLVGAVLGYAISAFLADRHTCDDPATGAARPTPYISFELAF